MELKLKKVKAEKELKEAEEKQSQMNSKFMFKGTEDRSQINELFRELQLK